MKNRMDMIVETYARQAGIVYEVRPELNTWTAFDSELKEFSRLIVQECMNACGSDSGTKQIRQHFGVEE
jgi:hypothetical protein